MKDKKKKKVKQLMQRGWVVSSKKKVSEREKERERCWSHIQKLKVVMLLSARTLIGFPIAMLFGFEH